MNSTERTHLALTTPEEQQTGKVTTCLIFLIEKKIVERADSKQIDVGYSPIRCIEGGKKAEFLIQEIYFQLYYSCFMSV